MANREILKPGISAVALYYDLIAISNLHYNTLYTQQIDFTWVTLATLSNVVSIQYSFTDSDGNSIDWTSLNTSTGVLTINPPALNQDQSMNISLLSTISYTNSSNQSENSPIYKIITLNINKAPCQVQNCNECESNQYDTWKQWITGYSISNDTGISTTGITTSNSCVRGKVYVCHIKI